MNTIVTLNITIIRFAMYSSLRCRIRVHDFDAAVPYSVPARRCRTIRHERDGFLTRVPDQMAVRLKEGDLLLLDDVAIGREDVSKSMDAG